MKSTNDRIKKCLVCGELFEDNTKPKNKVTCSSECATERKNLSQRIKYRKENPPKPNQRDLYYYDHHEYPFWVDEKIGDNQSWKVAVPHKDVGGIIAAREIEQNHGGRRRRQERIDYNGDEKGSHGVNVNFGKGKNREPSEVVTYTLTPEELAKYKERLKKK